MTAFPVRRILALRPRALGDLILTTPALRALALGHPGARLEVATEPRFAPVLAGRPEIAEVLPFPRTTAGTLAMVREVRARRYDLLVDFFGNPRTALVARLSGARHRYGWDLRGRRSAYHVAVPRAVAPQRGEREYAAAVHVRLALAAGGADDGCDPRITVTPAARASAEGLLAAAGIADPSRCVGLLAAGTWPTKTWPTGNAAILAGRLRDAGWDVVALLGPSEEHVGATLAAAGVRLLPACGVGELAGVVERLAAVVGNDSGPRHLAAALGVPTFAWFGPTHPDTWTPFDPRHGVWGTDLPCRACDRTACPHWSCMPSLSPDRAAALVLDHLARHVRTAPDLGAAARA